MQEETFWNQKELCADHILSFKPWEVEWWGRPQRRPGAPSRWAEFQTSWRTTSLPSFHIHAPGGPSYWVALFLLWELPKRHIHPFLTIAILAVGFYPQTPWKLLVLTSYPIWTPDQLHFLIPDLPSPRAWPVALWLPRLTIFTTCHPLPFGWEVLRTHIHTHLPAPRLGKNGLVIMSMAVGYK